MATSSKAVEHPPIHCIIMGDVGAKKSTLAATFPKPALVLMWDPPDKAGPYVRRGASCKKVKSIEGNPVTLVYNKAGTLIIRVEHYNDQNPRKPRAFKLFGKRMARIDEEYKKWKTVIYDSVTFMELAARKQQEYEIQPGAKDPRKWYAGSKDRLEEQIMIRAASLPMNVVVICHIDEDEDEEHGRLIHNPAMPGKLRKRAPGGFGEVYRAYRTKDGECEVQTEPHDGYNCISQIQAPDGCGPTYKELWNE